MQQQQIIEDVDIEGGQMDLIEIDEDYGSSEDENGRTSQVMHLKAKPEEQRNSQ